MEFTVEDYQNLIDTFEQHLKEAEGHIIKARRDLTIAEAKQRAWSEALGLLQSFCPDSDEVIQSIVVDYEKIKNVADSFKKENA